MICDIGHFTNAVHAEHRLANVYRRDSKRSRNRGANRRTAGHVVTHHERLIRNIILFAKKLETGIREFRKNPPMALDLWLKKYPVNLPRPLIEDYFSVLDYRFTDERKQSLALFFKLAAEMGLVESNPPIEFLE